MPEPLPTGPTPPDPALEAAGRTAPGRAIRWMAPALLLGVGLAGYGLLSRKPAKPPPASAGPQAVRTRVVEPRRGDHPIVLRSQGIARARHEVALSAQVGGRVIRVGPGFDDGAFFAAGEVLVEIEADDHRVAVTVAEARLESARAAFQLAELEHRRNAGMLRDALLPEAQAQVSAASLSQARAEVDAATAQLEKARLDLERTRVRAPFAGCVRRRTVGPGQLVGPGSALGTVFSIDTAEVRLPLAGRELHFLEIPDGGRAAAPVELVDAVDPAGGGRWTGRVVRLEGALDPDSLDLAVIVEVEDPFARRAPGVPLRPGHPVTARVRGRTLTGVVTLPRSAVRELDRVLLVDPATLTLTSRRVVPVWSDEEHVVVPGEAIPAGFQVATTHLVFAPEGARVEVIPGIPDAAGAAGAVPSGGKAAP